MREMHNLSSETRDKGSEGKPRVGCMDFARVPVDMSILPRISFDTQSISANRRFDVHDTPEVRVLLSHGPTEIMGSTHAREMYGTGTINYALSPRFRVPRCVRAIPVSFTRVANVQFGISPAKLLVMKNRLRPNRLRAAGDV